MGQQTAPRELSITLTDIALLARVQRPVVSMWRSRSAGTDHPFPAPLPAGGTPAVFDADAVAAWLETTGRGNNRTARQDVAAFATITGASAREDRAVFDALTALLCLKVISGKILGRLDQAELLDLADESDPDDAFLYRELELIGDRLPAVAQYADQLSDAAISAPAGFETLMANRFRSDLAEHSAAAITNAAQSLVAKIAVDLAARRPEPTVYTDPMSGSSDLLMAILHEHGDRGPFEVITPRADVSAARLARRRLRVHDVYRRDLVMDEDGAFALDRPVTHVVQYPGPGTPVMNDSQILAAIENIVVQMDDAQNGVVIAPATALSDAFADPNTVAIRADLLRAGHVRAIVRLPKGLATTRSRQALAVWVLGPSHHEDEPAERRTMIADLTDAELSEDVVDSLITDLSAATGSRELVRAHAFRFIHPVPTRVLLAAKRSLVETTASTPLRRTALDDDAALLLHIEQLRDRISAPASADLVLPSVTVGSARRESSSVTVAAMLAARRLRHLGGNRLDRAHLSTGDGVGVIGVPELLGDEHLGARTIDRLVLAGGYDAARLTEPGDVVFCTAPRPAALVDHAGGSVVAFPARVLRIDPADPGGLLPDVVAADINAVAPGARHWRQWRLRTVADDQRAVLTDALRELTRARAHVRQQLENLDLMSDLITRATTGGSLILQPNDAPTKGH